MCVLTASAQSPAPSSGKKPNILILWGDDIGYIALLKTNGP
jgi:hypothetical protein